MSPHTSEPDSNAVPFSSTSSRMRQLALQFAALFIVLSIAWPYFGFRDEPLPLAPTALAVGFTALLIASISRQAWWWRLIHFAFAPLVYGISLLAIDPGWFLLAFIVSLLVYRGALNGQIPLYFSSPASVAALTALLPETAETRFIDLGAGTGSIVSPLAKALPQARIDGIENAPATWLAGYMRTLRQKNCRWKWGSLWNCQLAEYDVVYAFLSPAPMPALWEKIEREMKPGSLFISNSFPVPDVPATRTIELDDARETRLYIYQR